MSASPIAVHYICKSVTERDGEILLLVFHLVGVILIIILGIIHIYKGGKDIETFTCKKYSFLKIKIVIIYTFGACYILFCCLNIWKHIDFAVGSEKNIHHIRVANYIITFVQIFILLIYFTVFHQRQHGYTCCQVIFSTFAFFFTYVGGLNDALLPEFLCKTNTSSTPQNITRATEALKKAEPLISAAIVGFSLLTIALIFANDSEPNGVSDLSINDTRESDLPTNETRLLITDSEDLADIIMELFKTTIQQFIFIVSFGIFAFTLILILLNHQSADLIAYIITQISIKAITSLLLLLLIILLILICRNKENVCKCSRMIFSDSVWLAIFIVTCIYHIFYHIVCIIRVEYIAHADIEILVLVENIVTITMALLETLFIVGTYLCRKFDDRVSKKRMECVYLLCSLMGMMNMGLWFSDIIGKDNLIYNPDQEPFWKLCKSFSLLLSIFYRFQTGLEFLKIYWHNNKRSEN